MKDAQSILRFILGAAGRGERAALVTITDVIGSSSRTPGTHMAVAEGGAYVGSFSGGCVEAAIVAESQRVIASGAAEKLRFGAGSRFIDIRLPCGGGMDFLILPDPDESAVRRAWEMLRARKAVALRMTATGALSVATSDAEEASAWDGDVFVARHVPDLRLVILGHGAEVEALAALGGAYGMQVTILSPDAAIADRVRAGGGEAHVLGALGRSPHLVADAHTALVFLFHDHDWETELLRQALETPAFYIGAMGSQRTHMHRVAALAQCGVDAQATDRLIGPIGLIPATRDPDTLALSILAQIVAQRDALHIATGVRNDRSVPASPERIAAGGR